MLQTQHLRSLVFVYASVVLPLLMTACLASPQAPNGGGATVTQGKKESSGPAPRGNSAEDVATSMWRKITTTCQVQGKELTFVETENYIHEFSNAWTKLMPVALSEADKLNGLNFKGVAFMSGAAFRLFHTDEKDNPSWQPGIEKARASVVTATGTGKESLGSFDAVWVQMEQRNGRYSFQFVVGHQFLMPGGEDGPHKYLLDELGARKRSCASLTGANPFETAQ